MQGSPVDLAQSLLQTVQTYLLINFVLAYKIGECIQTII